MSEHIEKVTIYDIAAKLGVSASTVTRALKNQSCISPETRKTVQETAEQMGYRKNLLAQGLKSPKIKIGLILRKKYPEYQKLIEAGARSACDHLRDFNAGIEVCMLEVDDYDNRLMEKISEFADNGCDGVIFTPCSRERTGDVEKIIREKKIRASTVYHSLETDVTEFYVGADYSRAGATAADLLSMCGIKKGDRVAYMTGFGNILPHHKENYASFMKMSEKYGFRVHLIEHKDNEKLAYDLTEKLLSEYPDIRGIYCSTAVTIPVCDKLKEKNRCDDTVVIGTELLKDFVPYIESSIINATIFQNPFKVGYLSYKTLYDCITGNVPHEKEIKINPQIVIRGNLAYYAERITAFDSEN